MSDYILCVEIVPVANGFAAVVEANPVMRTQRTYRVDRTFAQTSEALAALNALILDVARQLRRDGHHIVGLGPIPLSSSGPRPVQIRSQ